MSDNSWSTSSLNDSLSAMYGDLELAVERLQLIIWRIRASWAGALTFLKFCLEDSNFNIFDGLHLAMAI